jgi:hypothetical protein
VLLGQVLDDDPLSPPGLSGQLDDVTVFDEPVRLGRLPVDVDFAAAARALRL